MAYDATKMLNYIISHAKSNGEKILVEIFYLTLRNQSTLHKV